MCYSVQHAVYLYYAHVRMHLSEIHTQYFSWLNLQAWSHYSLASMWLLA